MVNSSSRGNIKKEIITFALAVLLAYLISFGYIHVLGLILHTKAPLQYVGSGSMTPTINIGDVVVVKGVEFEELKVGDIISFETPSKPIVHRIIAFEEHDGKTFIRTKGDANPCPDFFLVRYEDVIGKVIFIIPKIGYIFLFFETPLGYVARIGIFLALFVLWIGVENIVGIFKREEREKEKQ